MGDQDWDSVTVLRKKAPKPSELRTAQAVNQAMRTGAAIETTKKFAAGSNRQHTTAKNTAKLDQETEELHHQTVGIEVGRIIQQHRQTKGWTQKELATRVNEKQNVINEYESGNAIPNNQVMNKLERLLEVKLRGKLACRDDYGVLTVKVVHDHANLKERGIYQKTFAFINFHGAVKSNLSGFVNRTVFKSNLLHLEYASFADIIKSSTLVFDAYILSAAEKDRKTSYANDWSELKEKGTPLEPKFPKKPAAGAKADGK